MRLFEYREPLFTPGIIVKEDGQNVIEHYYVPPSLWWKVLNAPTNFMHGARDAWNWRQLSLPHRIYLVFYIGWFQMINP